jgi:flavin reductase (DIM6/NTAB) family NADH-FMN oxidoreductase RutF
VGTTGNGDTGLPPQEFVRVGARDNFYQSCAFIPMSFALVTSVGADGETGIGPHALCFPFNVTEPYAMMLISRHTSATAANIRRTGRCALNYVEFDRDLLEAIARLGYPGQDAAEKRRASPFTLDPSPLGSVAGGVRPRIVREAFQVLECTWDDSADLSLPRGSVPREATGKFVLRVDDILLQRQYRDGVEEGRRFPSMPIFMGFRAGGEFWFAGHEAPFPVAPPKVPGTEIQAVIYLANRLDDAVRFTDEACAGLAGVPRPFLQAALEKVIAAARERGVKLVDKAFLDDFNRARQGRAGQ